MSVSKQIKLIYNSYFSQPSSDRLIYRTIRRLRARRIVECGIGTTERARRIIKTAQLASPKAVIYYTGIDLFEARAAADGPGVSLKLAHRQLSSSGAIIKLIPGNPLSALASAANSLCNTDLLVISARQNPGDISDVWFFVPRIFHADSVILEEEAHAGGQLSFRRVSPTEIDDRAGNKRRGKAA